MNQIVGFGALVRFTLRRQWLRIVVWIASILLLVVITAASVDGLFPTQASLDRAAAASEDNAAALVFNGPAQALDTRGGQVAFQIGAFGLALAGLMSVVMIGSLTRGEEESGRMELVRSLPVGAHAPPLSAFAIVTAMNVAIGAGTAASLLALGLPTAGCVGFGLCFLFTGLMFSGITSVAAQLSENARLVQGGAIALLGASFLIRGIGDVTNGTASWFSPIGLVQKSRPFATERWTPFVIAALLTGVLFATGAALAARRDLAAGLVPPRPGPSRGGRLLASIEGMAVRSHRGAFAGWAAGTVVTAMAYGSIGDSVEEFIADNKAMLDLVARAGGSVDLTESFLATSFQVLCLLGAAFGIQAVLRIRAEETGLFAEPLLATSLPRWRWAASHLGVAVIGAAVVLLLGGFAVGLSYGIVTGNHGRTAGLVAAAGAYMPAVLVLIGAAVLVVGLAPRASTFAWVGLIFVFVQAMFGEILDLPQVVVNLSPVAHVPLMPAAPVDWTTVFGLSVVAAASAALGVVGVLRRDIG